MGSCDNLQVAWRKGPWTPQEDRMLIQYITNNGEGRWSSVSKLTGLNRSGKSCRLRWVNYLRPGLKKGHLTPQEEAIIIELHALWGNKWSTIARYLPGRTDNEIKNYWRTHFKSRKKPLKQEKRELHKQQQSNQTDDSMADISTGSLEAAKNEKEMGFPSMENDEILRMLNEEAASELVPVDCYLWGGLWNLQDSDANGCTVGSGYDENHGSDVGNCCYAFEGDAVDYAQGGGFIF